MSTQPAAIEITDLAKEYPPKQVLRGVNVRVPYGTTLCLLGPNGAGKTTTVEILQGLRRASRGTVRVLGEDPAPRTNAWRARIGVVSQASGDLGELTVREAVELASRFFADPMPVDEAVARVGLCDDARSRAGKLSGGRRRRLDIALAVVGRPELLFLDEPTTGFDPEARRGLWQLVSDLKSDGTTVLLTTHYLDEAEVLADDVAILLDGRVVEQGSPAALRDRAGQSSTVSWLEGPTRRSVETATPTAVVADLLARHRGADGEVPGLQVVRPSLEDHYLALITAHQHPSAPETARRPS
ncbi:MAG: ABC transporter ATP-binding protein [Actinomycetia bacterium]|nr:ABC transporter ATP-binding protein [Actinomycetes bacterium]